MDTRKVTYAWDDEAHSIVRFTVYPGWKWEEYYEVNSEIIAMMHTVDHPVYFLIDHTFTSMVPLGVFMHARNLVGAYPANCKLIVIVSPNVFVQRITSMFQSTYKMGLGGRIKSSKSFEQAYKMIEENKIKVANSVSTPG